MQVKTYSLFSITLPDEWDEYDDDEEGTFCFFNTIKWTGNLRITPFSWQDTISGYSKTAQYIEEEISNNIGAIKIAIGDFDCAFYKKYIIQDEDDLVIYYWNLGKGNDIYICSFTTDKVLENQTEINLVQEIVKSII